MCEKKEEIDVAAAIVEVEEFELDGGGAAMEEAERREGEYWMGEGEGHTYAPDAEDTAFRYSGLVLFRLFRGSFRRWLAANRLTLATARGVTSSSSKPLPLLRPAPLPWCACTRCRSLFDGGFLRWLEERSGATTTGSG